MRLPTMKRFFTARRTVFGAGAAVLTLVFLGGWWNPLQAFDMNKEHLQSVENAFEATAKTASPAVVFIQVEKKMPNMQAMSQEGSPLNDPFQQFNDDFLRRFFGERMPRQNAPQREYRVMGQGSGFIISGDGYIMTNNHVVGDADKVTVKLTDGRSFEAKVIGTDPQSDVAVIKIDATGLPALALGDSDSLQAGEWVIAVGNPFGLTHTVTAGIVSAVGRNGMGLADYEDFIQTDAAINPGNSGGPLLDLDGKVVGVNTAIFSRSGGYMGIGFAIPVNMARNIEKQLVENGKVVRGYLGVVIQELTPELSNQFGIKDSKGILVSEVNKDGAAGEAGVRQGDVITALDGKPVEHVEAFRNQIALTSPGTRINLTVLRDGEEKTLNFEVGKMPANLETATASGEADSCEHLGFKVQDLTKDLAERFGYQSDEGVLVSQVAPGSIAELAGIKAGTLITQVNRKPIKNVAEFMNSMKEASKESGVLFLVKDGPYSRYVVLEWQD